MSLKDIMTKLGKAGVPLAKVAILAKVPLDDAVSARETPAKVANLANLPPAERWRVSIEEWHPKAQDMLTLREKALQFLSSMWAERATSAGWSDIDLFGLSANDEAARYQYATWGLVTHLGLSVHRPSLAEINEDRATLRTAAGATHTKPRATQAEISRMFWECRL